MGEYKGIQTQVLMSPVIRDISMQQHMRAGSSIQSKVTGSIDKESVVQHEGTTVEPTDVEPQIKDNLASADTVQVDLVAPTGVPDILVERPAASTTQGQSVDVDIQAGTAPGLLAQVDVHQAQEGGQPLGVLIHLPDRPKRSCSINV